MSTKEPTIVVKIADMSEEMIEEVKRTAIEAFANAQQDGEREIAAHIKKKFDSKYGTMWHCVVGKQFGSYVSHERLEKRP